ncbi:MAG TPA: DUF2127 domain-containing protein [Gammaproteobacteria bacterium]
MSTRRRVRGVALFEATKGILVLLAGFGLLSLIHHDLQHVAEQLVGHLHLNPAKRYPQIFIDAASQLTSSRLWMLALLAASYSTARFVEAYGLWRERRWAEWFAVVSGSIYIPFELYSLVRGADGLSLGALLVNTVVVAVVLDALWRKRGQRIKQ